MRAIAERHRTIETLDIHEFFYNASDIMHHHFQQTMVCFNNERIEMGIIFQIIRQTDFNNHESMPSCQH